MLSKYLRANQVAQMLSIGKSTVWHYAKNGILPKPIKLSDKVTVWNRTEIETLLASRTNEPTVIL